QGDREGDRRAVAPHLDPFLAQHGEEAGDREAAPHSSPSRSRKRWINTSSSRAGTSCQDIPSGAAALSADSSRARSVPTARTVAPNTAALSTPDADLSARDAASRSGPVPSKTVSPACRTTSGAVPWTTKRPPAR